MPSINRNFLPTRTPKEFIYDFARFTPFINALFLTKSGASATRSDLDKNQIKE